MLREMILLLQNILPGHTMGFCALTVCRMHIHPNTCLFSALGTGLFPILAGGRSIRLSYLSTVGFEEERRTLQGIEVPHMNVFISM